MIKLVTIESIKLGQSEKEELREIDRLMASIVALGLLQPIVITSSGELVAGRRRLEACKRLGWTKIMATILEVKNRQPTVAERRKAAQMAPESE